MRIGLAWPPGVTTGWGVLALNMTLELIKRPDCHPFLILPPQPEALADPLHARLLQPLLNEQRQLEDVLKSGKSAAFEHPIIHSLTNHCQWGARVSNQLRGKPNLAYIFLEDTNITDEDRERARAVDTIFAGCTWNEAVLKANGIENVVTVTQGVDTSLFHPAPARGLFPGRFVVFGGGSLGFRKGQDIVVAAFKVFQQRHPEAFLLTAWQNPAPWTVADINQAGHVTGKPAPTPAGIDVKGWLIANGIPEESCLDVGAVPNPLTPRILREAHVALFPNRAEGGTNLVAMEAMACGVPCIISAGTGHKDLIGEGNCLPLTRTAPVKPSPVGLLANAGTEDWVECSVEDCVEKLETVYQDRALAAEVGTKGAAFMAGWSWEKQIETVVGLTLRPFITAYT